MKYLGNTRHDDDVLTKKELDSMEANLITPDNVPRYTGNLIYPQGQNNIVYNPVAKRLILPRMNIKVGARDNWIDGHEVALGGNAGFLMYDGGTKKVRNGTPSKDGDMLLGYYDNIKKRVFLNSPVINTRIKKIACLGDSITFGTGAGGVNGWQYHRYIHDWCRFNGIETTIVNLGIGGTTVSDGARATDAFVKRLDSIPTDADVLVIWGGTNDYGNNTPLGTMVDSGTKTFYGAYKYLLDWMIENRPTTRILIITPLKRYYKGSSTTFTDAQITPNKAGHTLFDYVQAIREVAELYSLPYVDLFLESGLNPVSEIVRTRFIPDGLHPNAEGNKRIYPKILAKLRPLLEYD